jgi:hypothetical protein
MVRADRGKRLLDSAFDERNFGNFHISYKEGAHDKSIINDRGELVLCRDLEGRRKCTTVLSTLQGADQRTLRAALRL